MSMPRIIFALFFLVMPIAAQATEAGWAALREGGHVVLLSHAMANGTTDPANFDIAVCTTQRNLSARGKQQARKIGALFGARAAPVDLVLSSNYCRCLDTARMAFESEPEPFPALDLPKGVTAEKAAQMAEIIGRIRDYSGSGNLIMITHGQNIQNLTGISPHAGEAVIVAPDGDGLRVLGRVRF
jgi:phosphohistidine phosphatase SixA